MNDVSFDFDSGNHEDTNKMTSLANGNSSSSDKGSNSDIKKGNNKSFGGQPEVINVELAYNADNDYWRRASQSNVYIGLGYRDASYGFFCRNNN